MVNQVKHDPINSLVYQITEKHLHTDVFNNIMQHLDTGVPVLHKILFDNRNIAYTQYRNNIEDTIENLDCTQKYCRKIKTPVAHDQSGCVLRTKYGAWHEFSEDTCLRLTIASGQNAHAKCTWHRILLAGSESEHTAPSL